MMMDELREQLAALAHEMWSGWMRYMLGRLRPNDDGSVTISSAYCRALSRQMSTPYAALSEDEKNGDREEADRVLALVQPLIIGSATQDTGQGIDQSVSGDYRNLGARQERAAIRLCAVEGCGGRAYRDYAYCTKHRLRVERQGDPNSIGKPGRKKQPA
jgi:hypothetical protein